MCRRFLQSEVPFPLALDFLILGFPHLMSNQLFVNKSPCLGEMSLGGDLLIGYQNSSSCSVYYLELDLPELERKIYARACLMWSMFIWRLKKNIQDLIESLAYKKI